jgi:hypothetical protein
LSAAPARLEATDHDRARREARKIAFRDNGVEIAACGELRRSGGRSGLRAGCGQQGNPDGWQQELSDDFLEHD